MNVEERDLLDKYITVGHGGMNLLPEHKYVMGFAWVIPRERRIFNLFPEIMTVNTVASTNKENRPLLTITGKDSNGKMFIILRAFLTHEQSWNVLDIPRSEDYTTLFRSVAITEQ